MRTRRRVPDADGLCSIPGGEVASVRSAVEVSRSWSVRMMFWQRTAVKSSESTWCSARKHCRSRFDGTWSCTSMAYGRPQHTVADVMFRPPPLTYNGPAQVAFF